MHKKFERGQKQRKLWGCRKVCQLDLIEINNIFLQVSVAPGWQTRFPSTVIYGKIISRHFADVEYTYLYQVEISTENICYA